MIESLEKEKDAVIKELSEAEKKTDKLLKKLTTNNKSFSRELQSLKSTYNDIKCLIKE